MLFVAVTGGITLGRDGRGRPRSMVPAALGATVFSNPDVIVVYDIPLLVEAGRHEEFEVVVVHASTETRAGRMVERCGMRRDEPLHRIRAQATDTDRLAVVGGAR